ncbi:MAG TPA: TadE/TadG family type IV pilus assembly protein [Terriglobales bacterium]|nr:TadE/TadG family type IV pilus assembly protein [Terriglobales bacterium]
MELAISLPLLMIIVVGITDFGTAFNLKQNLNNAVREGARSASKQSMQDVTNPTPLSTDAIRAVIDNYLLAARVNDCGLSGAVPSKSVSGLIWTYTASSGCPGGGTLTLIVDRGNTFQTGSPPPTTIETTHIQISYPYQWRFGRFIKFFVPTANYASGVTQINGEAIMTNLN